MNTAFSIQNQSTSEIVSKIIAYGFFYSLYLTSVPVVIEGMNQANLGSEVTTVVASVYGICVYNGYDHMNKNWIIPVQKKIKNLISDIISIF